MNLPNPIKRDIFGDACSEFFGGNLGAVSRWAGPVLRRGRSQMRRVGNGFSLDFGPPVEPGFEIGKPSAFEQRTSNQNKNNNITALPN
jgi:hypothetical protein